MDKRKHFSWAGPDIPNGLDVPFEDRYRLLVDAVQDYAIFMLDPQGCVSTWNGGAERIKGYPAEEIIGRHFSVFYGASDVAQGKPGRELAAAAAQGRVEDEGWRVRRDGSRFWANVIITAIRGSSGQLLGYAKITRDLTEPRRLAELEQTNALSAQIEYVRENEQKRIARELHDDLGQQLAALKIALVLLDEDLVASCALPKELSAMRDIQVLLDGLAVTVRRIAEDLRPPLLDDCGLVAGIEWLADNFSRRHGVPVSLQFPAVDRSFNDAASTAIFRITQEALTNVARHAQASRVEFEMAILAESLMLRIEDDGIGLPSEDQQKSRSFGLLGMRERVGQLNGTIVIDNAAGHGVRIQIRWPLIQVMESGRGLPS